MNARRARITMLCALLATGSAVAADWARIDAAGGDLHAYDRSKLAIRGDEITYWRKVTFAKPVRVRTGQAKSAVYQERIHCRDYTLKALGWQVFAEDGVVLESTTTADADATSIVPETVGDRFRDVMCQLVEARRRRDADLVLQEGQLAARRKELDQLKLEVDQLETIVLRMRLEAAQSLPAPAPAGVATTAPPATASGGVAGVVAPPSGQATPATTTTTTTTIATPGGEIR